VRGTERFRLWTRNPAVLLETAALTDTAARGQEFLSSYADDDNACKLRSASVPALHFSSQVSSCTLPPSTLARKLKRSAERLKDSTTPNPHSLSSKAAQDVESLRSGVAW